MARTRAGIVLGPLVLGKMRAREGASLVEPVTTWANGLLHRGLALRIIPYRPPAYRQRARGLAVLIAWRM